MARWHVAKDGEWITPIRRGYRLACCHCGLTHVMDFKIRNGGRDFEFRATRNERSTALIRRHKKARKKKRAK